MIERHCNEMMDSDFFDGIATHRLQNQMHRMKIERTKLNKSKIICFFVGES